MSIPVLWFPAWHKGGHMAVAPLAWRQLTEKERTHFANLLTAFPHYDVHLRLPGRKAWRSELEIEN